MVKTIDAPMNSPAELEKIIAQALQRIKANNASELCHYLPQEGGHMHHFTLKKLQRKSPKELAELLQKYIIEPATPQMVAPKKRSPRGSRKRAGMPVFSRAQLDKLLEMARKSGDQELIRALSPKQSLQQCKKTLIASIRHNKVEPELWEAYIRQQQVLSIEQTQA